VTYGTVATLAAKQATTTIPIVMTAVGDPIGAKLVASLGHPGGNVTGNTILGPEVGPKRLQLLKEAFPRSRGLPFFGIPRTRQTPSIFTR
jgi:putative ABC transport system substrate-binding protein